MRTRLNNLILHTTALIARKKSKLLVSHALASIAAIAAIILLEIFLIIISIPLYTVYGNLEGYNKTRRLINRVVFFAVLAVILMIVMAKLISLAGFPLA